MPGVFTYRASSPYDDVPGERYHFPRAYLSRVERLVGDWVAFHELKDRGRGANGYVSFARVERVDPDPARADHFYARLSGAGTFAAPVPVHGTHRPVEVGFNPQNAVRIIGEGTPSAASSPLRTVSLSPLTGARRRDSRRSRRRSSVLSRRF